MPEDILNMVEESDKPFISGLVTDSFPTEKGKQHKKTVLSKFKVTASHYFLALLCLLGDFITVWRDCNYMKEQLQLTIKITCSFSMFSL